MDFEQPEMNLERMKAATKAAIKYIDGVYPLPAGSGPKSSPAVGISPGVHQYKIAIYLPAEADRVYLGGIKSQIQSELGTAQVDIDVSVIGNLIPLNSLESADVDTKDSSSVSIGSCISHFVSIGAGTLGCFVRKNDGDSRIFMLSCSHVLTNNYKGSTGDHILCKDSQEFTVGQLHEFINLEQTPLDAAIAEVDRGICCDNYSWITNSIQIKGFLSFDQMVEEIDVHVRSGKLYPVFKLGKQSGLTCGTIDALEISKLLSYGEQMACEFDFISIRSLSEEEVFATPGDSGSLVVNRNGYVIGMLVATTKNNILSFANRIDMILEALDVTILTTQN